MNHKNIQKPIFNCLLYDRDQRKLKSRHKDRQSEIDDAKHEKKAKSGILQSLESFADDIHKIDQDRVDGFAKLMHMFDAPRHCNIIMASPTIASTSLPSRSNDISCKINTKRNQDRHWIDSAAEFAIRSHFYMAMRSS
ncbi:hypothetical protein SELSPUOL_01885 [Selenomonas sputigena ATCC 35185]|uniref:Uncharacterized protein n=1 Tax=Selenomonas sputigena (strain ATCC 35185 / DSM 20758 / CCUG 44933 / VPI D19B-28) TaxID=546271 RepID=C9LWN0_SELS3|nr:hypothetical protein SELSPUOL_01885 [Selenomonas sputigena ATCC 35185]